MFFNTRPATTFSAIEDDGLLTVRVETGMDAGLGAFLGGQRQNVVRSDETTETFSLTLPEVPSEGEVMTEFAILSSGQAEETVTVTSTPSGHHVRFSGLTAVIPAP